MNRVGACFVALGVVAGSTLVPVGSTTRAAGVSGRYLVQFVDGTDPDLEAAVLRADGVEVVEVYRDVFPGVAVRADAGVVDAMHFDPVVATVEPDQVITLDATAESFSQPVITQTGAQLSWGLDRIDQRSLPLSNSYAYNGAGAGVTAYVVDSGIHADHVDFGGRVRPGFTTISDGRGTEDCPPGVALGHGTGHGTHVAGTLGGQTYGVAKSVSLVAVRVLDCTGSTTEMELVNALEWVIADHPAGTPAVVNMSIGGGKSTVIDRAVQAVIDDGVTVAVAAGNAQLPNPPVDACTGSPADATNALTVAASSESDARASFSDFGSCVDLFAPGANIRSTFIDSPTSTAVGNGTSMATPHVAGAAAVLLSEHPTWTPAQVSRDLLARSTSDVVTDPGLDTPNKLLFAPPITPPTNDQFASATAVDVTGPAALAGSNVDATIEPGEPTHGPISGGTSVWWSFVAPDYGIVTMSTEGSTFDTMLAAYSGAAVNALVPLASNDGVGNGSAVSIRVEAGHTYHIAVDGAVGLTGSIALAFTWSASSFVPLVPARLLETRAGSATVDGLFAGVGVRGAGSVTELVVAGRGGVVGDASAVVLTVTVTEPVSAGFVTVFPCGSPRPLASNVNFVAGSTVANSVVSGVGVGGRVCLFTMAATQLVVDVNGYFPASSSFAALVPARLLETRAGLATVDGLFAGVGVRGAGSVTELVVAGRGGVVGDASAVVLTVTVTEPVGAGFVTVFPCGSPRPLASNVNFVAGSTVANSVVSGVGVGGRVCRVHDGCYAARG